MNILGLQVHRRSTVERHAAAINRALNGVEAMIFGGDRDASPRQYAAMGKLHAALSDAADALALVVQPMSGGLPKPPKPE